MYVCLLFCLCMFARQLHRSLLPHPSVYPDRLTISFLLPHIYVEMSACQFIYLSHLSGYQSVFRPHQLFYIMYQPYLCQLVNMYVCLFEFLSVYLTACLPACLHVCVSEGLSVCLYRRLPVCLPAFMSFCLSVYLCVCLSKSFICKNEYQSKTKGDYFSGTTTPSSGCLP